MLLFGAIITVILFTVLFIIFIIFRDKHVKLYKNFDFKYKIRVIGQQGSADTQELEAIVKAKSFNEAEQQLIKELKSQFKIQVLITWPVKESR